jgi:hypothetical protein
MNAITLERVKLGKWEPHLTRDAAATFCGLGLIRIRTMPGVRDSMAISRLPISDRFV